MTLNISYSLLSIIALVASLIGYAFFVFMKRSLPQRLSNEHLQQRNRVVSKAKQRRDQIISEAQNRDDNKINIYKEELEAQVRDNQEDLDTQKAEVALQEEFLEREEHRLQKKQTQYDLFSSKVQQTHENLNKNLEKLSKSRDVLHQALSDKSCLDADSISSRLTEETISERHLDCQKRIKELTEDLNSNSKKVASRSLSRVLSRYEPQFSWPKPISHVDINNKKSLESLYSDKYSLLAELTEITDKVEIALSEEKNQIAPAIKLGGGFGIDKEAARLTLEDLIPKGPNAWQKASKVFAKHRRQLDQISMKLGKQAINELQLEGVAPEIQKMVGDLNWRTSYRQNQFYHSLEVAKLAGIIANELSVDPTIAKRCGLLHDIGKGIDYRIEGSHAVISGDYADRFGEAKLICDTVMSHHNDLVLETPLSYVLKSADTLSGARPGARVNLEEGYQIRLTSIEEVVRSFPGILKIAIMNGGREVHIEVNHKKVKEHQLTEFTSEIARKIEVDVAFPGQIKVLVSRRFEATSVA